MSESIIPHRRQQEQVNVYFKSQSSFWKDIYTSGDVYAEIHRDRHTAVLAWLGRAELAIQEMARVTRAGGYIIFTADNRSRLNLLLDPWQNPVLVPLRRRVKAVLEGVGLRRRSPSEETRTPLHHFHDRRFI